MKCSPETNGDKEDIANYCNSSCKHFEKCSEPKELNEKACINFLNHVYGIKYNRYGKLIQC